MIATAAVSTLALSGLASAMTSQPASKRCTGTISAIGDVAEAIKCTTININKFTVPAKTALDLSGLLAGTTVNLLGDVTFTGKALWDGPMFLIGGSGITFNGGGHTFDGQGATYWDTLGSNTGGSQKPQFLKLTLDGTFTNLKVLNSPRHVFSVGNKKALTISGINIDNSAANALASNGKKLGHNTDCFDVSGTDTTITGSTCSNQDDCIAINAATGVTFSNNKCIGGHGISIGSVASGKTVSNVHITGNTVTNSDNGLRIKTISGATGASVSGVTYSGNTVTGASKYGVVIQQDYLNGGPTGTPTNGVPIKDVVFTGINSVSVGSSGLQVYVLCGTGTCTGNWNWSGLKTSGGKVGTLTPQSVPITGYTKPPSS